MKCLYIIVLAFLFSASAANAGEQGPHLFILSGQSNMERMNPAISFTPAVETAFGKDNVIVVKAAWGGQPISRWYKKWKSATGEVPEKTGDLYDLLMKSVNEASKGKQIKTVTFVWMQGERDALRKQADVYEESLKGLLVQLSQDLKREDINVVIGRLSDSAKYKDWRIVREAQMKIAETQPSGAWVDTDDLNSGVNEKGEKIEDNLHFSVEGYKFLGKRFADKSIELINRKK